jgi:hypothetical protein
MPNKLGIYVIELGINCYGYTYIPNKLGICIIELGINRGHAFPD